MGNTFSGAPLRLCGRWLPGREQPDRRADPGRSQLHHRYGHLEQRGLPRRLRGADRRRDRHGRREQPDRDHARRHGAGPPRLDRRDPDFDGENHDTTIRNNRIAGDPRVGRPSSVPGVPIGAAIRIDGSGCGVSIVGNKIGLNAIDRAGAGQHHRDRDVALVDYRSGVQNVVIGGSAPGEGNEIAGHLVAGISVANTFSGVRISGNSIHDNGDIGIDLVTPGFQYGVTAQRPRRWRHRRQRTAELPRADLGRRAPAPAPPSKAPSTASPTRRSPSSSLPARPAIPPATARARPTWAPRP